MSRAKIQATLLAVTWWRAQIITATKMQKPPKFDDVECEFATENKCNYNKVI